MPGIDKLPIEETLEDSPQVGAAGCGPLKAHLRTPGLAPLYSPPQRPPQGSPQSPLALRGAVRGRSEGVCLRKRRLGFSKGFLVSWSGTKNGKVLIDAHNVRLLGEVIVVFVNAVIG